MKICSAWSDVSSERVTFLYCHFLNQICIHPFEWLSNDVAYVHWEPIRHHSSQQRTTGMLSQKTRGRKIYSSLILVTICSPFELELLIKMGSLVTHFS